VWKVTSAVQSLDWINKHYAFADKFETLRNKIKEPLELMYFDQWLWQFKYQRAIAVVQLYGYQLQKLIAEIGVLPKSWRKQAALEKGLCCCFLCGCFLFLIGRQWELRGEKRATGGNGGRRERLLSCGWMDISGKLLRSWCVTAIGASESSIRGRFLV
jgi:hypothetical protein